MDNLRQRALDILLASPEYTKKLDNALDALCREHFNLPPRPANREPFTGWMAVTPEKPTQETTKPTKIGKRGLDLIKDFEGLKLKAYICPAGVYTIGYGHTATAKPGVVIAPYTATKLLEEDVKKFEKAVVDLVNVPLNQNQFDALVSFTFNVGRNAFASSTLLRKLNDGDYLGASKEFSRWTKAGGRYLPGLGTRRKAEMDLFLL